FEILMSLVVSSLVINWIMISYTHLKYRKQKETEGTKTLFPSFMYPISNYICLLFLIGILVIMWFTGLKISVELIPAWLLFLYIAYQLVKRNKAKQ
ncbi:MAG TPA: aromatic amino acid transporter AroP, partial [Faecalibacter sp.]